MGEGDDMLRIVPRMTAFFVADFVAEQLEATGLNSKKSR